MTGTVAIALLLMLFFTLAACHFLGRARVLLDHPGKRSLHSVPTPRTGGLAMNAVLLGAVVAAWALAPGLLPGALWLGGWLLVVAVSAADDLADVSPFIRLKIHLLAAALVVIAAGPANWFIALIGVLSLSWFVNLFNFMDGMDGLAGSMALAGSLALAALGWLGGDLAFFVQSLAVAAVVAGFLPHNLPPARIFMGDAGSAGLGILLGGLSWMGVSKGLFPWQAPILIFLPFLVDATLTLLIRMLRRKRIWEAHREHAYQALVLKGWNTRRALSVELGIISPCAVMGVLTFLYPGLGTAMLLAALGILVILYFRAVTEAQHTKD